MYCNTFKTSFTSNRSVTNVALYNRIATNLTYQHNINKFGFDNSLKIVVCLR